MEFFKWKEDFNIGEAEIDSQHRSFLEHLNEYYVSASGDMKDVGGAELVQRLKEYAAIHFRFEEDLMESVGYDGLVRQRAEHRYFESLVADLESAQLQGKKEVLKTSLGFIRDWFLRHILEEDKKIALYIRRSQK